MIVCVYTTKDEGWNIDFQKLPIHRQDIYFTREYYKMHELNGDGQGLCFVYKTQKKIALYPFLLNQIKNYSLNEDCYDIESAYGYGGPVVSHDDDDFIKAFEAEFLNYCKSKKIVAEFIRFNPMIQNEKVFQYQMNVHDNRKTVCLDLTRSVETIWKSSLSSENRNRIRKAEKNGLKVEQSKNYARFKEIYKETMMNHNAEEYYYFTEDYFNALFNNDHCHLFNVMKEEKVLASAVFMPYENYCHYHLGGSVKSFRKLAPNNMLFWFAIQFAHENQVHYFHFGGGRTLQKEDTLFRFKSRFSKTFLDFKIGKRIHNQEIYSKLIEHWEKENQKKATFFLQYKFV